MDFSDYMRLFKPNPTGQPQQNDSGLNNAMANSKANAQSAQAQQNQAQGGAIKDLSGYFMNRPKSPAAAPGQGVSFNTDPTTGTQGFSADPHGIWADGASFGASNPAAASTLAGRDPSWLTTMNNTPGATSAATGAAAGAATGAAAETAATAAGTSGATGSAVDAILAAMGIM